MTETIEFRIPAVYADQYLPDNVGQQRGMARRLELSVDDPLVDHVKRIDRTFRAKGRAFFTFWTFHRRYSVDELERAALILVSPARVFEPAGEECGTEYDDSKACPTCGGGGEQKSVLRLDLRKVPRTVDFAETIAGERVVAQRFAECLVEAEAKGVDLRRVVHRSSSEDSLDLAATPSGRILLERASYCGISPSGWHLSVWLNRSENRSLLEAANAEFREQRKAVGRPVPLWYQIVVTSPPVEVHSRTRVGEDPFDEERKGGCPRGDVIGLNRLSELTVRRTSLSDADVMGTWQMIGVRRGLLRPHPLLLLSQRLWRAVAAAGIRGLLVEAVHVA